MGEHRNRVADVWDAYVGAWIEGDDALDAWLKDQDTTVARDLTAWQNSYTGTGRGALDLTCFPDPFTGDLRGVNGEPLLVVLGLNPGVGYPKLHGRDGIWTNRIREASFSRCFERSPPGDRNWLELHGRESVYWRNLIRFGQRWCGDGFTFRQLLNFELYPWHSNSLTAGLRCPPEVVDRYVFQPLAEVETRYVFAFGRGWDDVCRGLGLPVVRRYGDGADPFPGASSPGWTVVVFRSATMAAPIIVSWQHGYAGPPGERRLETLRAIIDDAA
ncbi:hypothetical protein WMF20_28365 [Sorangium sp. So ce834]|uniref:anti-phage DNA glycosylase Brig1 n=1 Tax=Sorangium sp. So ce834 TaxID=3133321 RepID=UPI003F645D16